MGEPRESCLWSKTRGLESGVGSVDPVGGQKGKGQDEGSLTCSGASQGRLPGHIGPAPADSILQPGASWAPPLLVPVPPVSLWDKGLLALEYAGGLGDQRCSWEEFRNSTLFLGTEWRKHL